MRIRRDSFLVFSVCMGISIFVLISLDSQQGNEVFFGIGPIRYVQYLCYALIALGSLVFFQGIEKEKNIKKFCSFTKESAQDAPFDLIPFLKIFSLLISFFIFMFLFKNIGFVSSGILLMLLTSFIIRGFIIPKFDEFFFQLLFSFAIVLFIYISFDIFLMVDLP